MRKIILLLLLLAPLPLSAQSYDDGYSHHQIGVEASMISGVGGTYSYIFDSVYRVKTTFWAYYEDNDNGNTNWTESVGLQLQMTLFRAELSRFYGFVGGFYYSHINNGSSYGYLSDYYESNNYTSAEHNFAGGLGVGVELMAWRHIALYLEGSFQYAGTNFSSGSRSRYIGPGIGAGMAFRF
ncbi:MAG: hypothetical protein ABI778_05290 [Ignavibacteriota bacterium]